jgi:hypothetical protein
MTRPTSKRERERDTDSFARGGKTHMLGKGTRTATTTPDAAGEQTPGANKSKDNRRSAKGGPPVHVGGLALPAQPGHCAPIHKGR